MANTNAGYGFATVSPTASLDISGGIAEASPDSFLTPHHPPQLAASLIATARALVWPRGKGIYATDETPEGIEARLAAAEGSETEKVWSEEEKRERRKKWRECLYATLPTEHISGVILFSETLHAFNLAPLLISRSIIPGIRADTDSQPLPISTLEPATQGLDDLLPRLLKAHAAGARFAKWRAPILCDEHKYPTQAALEVQAESLARFASIAQQAGLVPIVEPDVDYSGDASLAKSVDVHVRIVSMIYARCLAYGVLTEGTLIKPSFAQPGLKHPSRATTSASQIALATLTALSRSLPLSVAGIAFLSGGLSDEDAAAYLSAANKLVNTAKDPSPFARLPPLTFSFGRGLQGDAMKRWVSGDEEGAREAFRERASVCSKAAVGEY